jgi:hypothetical protein
MTKFTAALREIASCHDVLRTSVDATLCVGMRNFHEGDLSEVKELRKRFDKSTNEYDQVIIIILLKMSTLVYVKQYNLPILLLSN